jgi:hypothetical protein
MGILDDNTRRILRDGKVLDAMHRMADRQPSDRGVKVEISMPNRNGRDSVTKQVIIRKVVR